MKHFVNLPKTTKAVLFDMDGVIFNTEDLAHAVFAGLANDFGNIFDEDDHRAVLGSSQEFWTQYLMSKWSVSMAPDDFSSLFWQRLKQEIEKDAQILPGFIELIKKIRSNHYKTAVVTSSPKDEVEFILKKFDLYHLFDDIIAGDDILHGKPDPDPYIQAMKRLELNAGGCVVIEDSINGVRSGKAAGCYVIAVPTLHASGLNYGEADKIVRSLQEIQ